MGMFVRYAEEVDSGKHLGGGSKSADLDIMQAVTPRLAAACLLAATLLAGPHKKVPLRTASNDLVEITANAWVDREGINQLIGADLESHYVVVEIRLQPKDDKKVTIQRDDFMMRTDKDGERARPFAPSQIAGVGALVISQSDGSNGGFARDGNGPIVGGSPGGGRPRKLGGDGAATGSSPGGSSATVVSGANEKPGQLLDVLRQKELPIKETAAPVSGLLYFPLEKQKLKDLELIYTTPEGKLNIRFR
jgi:hypothetical protein